MLKDLALGVTEDKSRKLADLEKRKSEIEKEISILQTTNLLPYEPTRVRENFQLIEESAIKLLSDFKQMEEIFRRLNSTAREDQIRTAGI